MTNLFVSQDVSWFDNPKNTTGALTTRLANDAAQVKGVRTSFLRVFILMLFEAERETGFLVAILRYGY